MSKNKKSWGFIKRENRGCFENVNFRKYYKSIHFITHLNIHMKSGYFETTSKNDKIKHENNKTK